MKARVHNRTDQYIIKSLEKCELKYFCKHMYKQSSHGRRAAAGS